MVMSVIVFLQYVCVVGAQDHHVQVHSIESALIAAIPLKKEYFGVLEFDILQAAGHLLNGCFSSMLFCETVFM